MEIGGKGVRREDEVGDGRRLRDVVSVDRGQNLGVRGREEVSAEAGVEVLEEASCEEVTVEVLEEASGEEVTVEVRDEVSAERLMEEKPVDEEDCGNKMVGIGEEVTSEGGGGKEEEELCGGNQREEAELCQGKQEEEEEEEVGRGKQNEELCVGGVGGKLKAEVNSAEGISIGAGPVAGRPTRWADLPRELIEKIAIDHLECAVDKVCMSLISRHWRFSMSGTQHSPILPWLFLPSPDAPVFFNPARGCLHPVPMLPDDVKELSPCGSCTGGWLFMNGREAGKNHIMYNFKTGARVTFSTRVIMVDKDEENFESDDTSLVVCSASGVPSSPGTKVVGVISAPQSFGTVIALWDQDEDQWAEIACVMDGWSEGSERMLDYEVLDMIFYDGSFHLLTGEEDIIRLVASGSGVQKKFHVRQRANKYAEEMYQHKLDGKTIKYLVESTGGDLVMCIKFVRENKTEFINMYRLSVAENMWLHYGSPKGEVIFLGRGCSKSYLTEGMHSEVHFLDDTENKINLEDHLTEGMHSEVHFLDDMEDSIDVEYTDIKIYEREDMGCFCDYQRSYSAPPELVGTTSTLSPPVWFYH